MNMKFDCRYFLFLGEIYETQNNHINLLLNSNIKKGAKNQIKDLLQIALN